MRRTRPETPTCCCQQQLALLPESMLVLGVAKPQEFGHDRLAMLLEGSLARPVLIVRPIGVEFAGRSVTMARSRFRQPTILPGFGLTLGFTTFFLSVLVLMPLAALVFTTQARCRWPQLLDILLDERAPGLLSPFLRGITRRRAINTVFGFIVAWTLVRYEFPGRSLDALIDLPFALPTAVAGIALTAVFAAERLDRPVPRSRLASRWPTRRWASWSR